MAIANLLEQFTTTYGANFATAFSNYYTLTATIMHLFNRSRYPLLFSPSALKQCTDFCRKVGGIWSSLTRTLHVVEGVDHEVENTMHAVPNAFATSSFSPETAAVNPGQSTGGSEDPSSFWLTSWPSLMGDLTWLSSEPWRMSSEENITGDAAPTTGYFHN